MEAKTQAISQIEGRILDAKTGKCIANALAFLVGSKVSTISKQDGKYILLMENEKDTIVVKCLGYELYKKSLQRINMESGEINLVRRPMLLHEVVIKSETAENMVKAALEKIETNYAIDSTWVKAYFKSAISEDSIITEHSEFVVYIKLDELTPIRSDSVFIVHGRSLIRTKGRLPEFNTLNYQFKTDPVKYPLDFMKGKGLKNYNYSLEEVILMDGSPTYLVSFDQKSSIKRSLFCGKLYLDSASLAFRRIEYSTSAKGIVFWKQSNAQHLLWKTMFKCFPTANFVLSSADYKRKGNKWTLNGLNTIYKLSWQTTEGPVFTEKYDSELIMCNEVGTNRDMDSVKEKVMKYYFPLWKQQTVNDDDFWDKFSLPTH
ncbi:MAG: carboxypeptidase-like regulatory domain-containing protein [Bacteroidia bacterium]